MYIFHFSHLLKKNLIYVHDIIIIIVIQMKLIILFFTLIMLLCNGFGLLSLD